MRPAVDVVVPFAGSDAAFRSLIDRLLLLRLRDDDQLIVVDNGPSSAEPRVGRGPVRVVVARETPSSYFARNAGAAEGSNPWILFIDADVVAPASLVDDYFGIDYESSIGVVAGGIVDADLTRPGRPTLVSRYSSDRGSVGHETTNAFGQYSYAQTANALVRREAFQQVGGFRTDIRSGGDADFCFRVREAAWSDAVRYEAAVTHQNRSTLRALLRQQARYGSGTAWLDERYAGFSTPIGIGRAAVVLCAKLARFPVVARRAGPDEAGFQLLDGLCLVAFEFGRTRDNRVKEA